MIAAGGGGTVRAPWLSRESLSTPEDHPAPISCVNLLSDMMQPGRGRNRDHDHSMGLTSKPPKRIMMPGPLAVTQAPGPGPDPARRRPGGSFRDTMPGVTVTGELMDIL